jgi:monoterpene epsilon-lactone hydrolase
MPSLSMRVAALLLKATFKPRMATEERARRRLLAPKRDAAPPATLTRRHRVEVHSVNGFTCYRVAPSSTTRPGVVVYLHGGAYFAEMTKQHWSFVDELVGKLGCPVEVPIYGLAPQHDHREAFHLLDALFAELVADHDAKEVVFVGDSAGGGLALAFAQTLLETDRPQPGLVVLISPWLDISLDNPAIAAVELHDPWLSSVGLRVVGAAWAADADPTDPRVSPINGSLRGLAPIDAYIGTRDLFLPDTRKLRDLVFASGGDIRLHEAEGAFHVYVLTPVAEGRRDRTCIIEGVRARLGP